MKFHIDEALWSTVAKLAAYYQFISYFPNYFKKLVFTIFFLPSTRGASRERQGRVRQIRFALSRFAPV
jgi:hypothetical protein